MKICQKFQTESKLKKKNKFLYFNLIQIKEMWRSVISKKKLLKERQVAPTDICNECDLLTLKVQTKLQKKKGKKITKQTDRTRRRSITVEGKRIKRICRLLCEDEKHLLKNCRPNYMT